MSDPAPQPIIILGAGHGKRMGGPKIFTATGNQTFLARILDRAREAGSPVILTVDPGFRKRAEALLADLQAPPLRMVDADGTKPMLTSVQAGMRALTSAEPGAWLWPVDAPLLSAEGWKKARAAVSANPDLILKLRTGGRTGHPAWFPRWACSAVLAATWDNGLLGYLAELPGSRIATLELPGEILTDFNTPEQLAAVRH